MELSRDQLQKNLDIALAKNSDLENELQINEATFSRYLTLSEVILVALDDQARITMIGGKGCELLGYSAEELNGQNWFQACLPVDNYETVFTIYKSLMAGDTEHVDKFENEILTKSGKKRHIAWHNALLKDSTDNIVGTLSSGVDITERKLVEDSLRDNELILNKVQEIAHIGSWDWDTINNTAKLSPELCKIYDIPPGQFDGDISSLG